MAIRRAGAEDDQTLGEIMFDAVRSGPSRYTEAQRRAWVGAPRAGADWSARLSGQYVVMEEVDGRALGFMSLRPDGYVDFAYIRPEAQGTGLFRRLFAELLAEARRLGLTRLFVYASLTAQPAFSAVGFAIIRKEEVPLGGEVLARFEMERLLEPGP